MKLVEVSWRDIVAHADWTPLNSVKIPTFKTTGSLVKKTKDDVILAHTFDELGQPFGFDAFPRGCIIAIKPLDL